MDEIGLTGTVFLDGHLVSAARARVSAFDRGLLYGDGLFETLRSYQGRPFALDRHLARLRGTARWLGIPVPAMDWRRQITAVLQRNRLLGVDASVRITLTRGPAVPGLLPPVRPRPTVLIICAAVPAALAAVQRRGARVALLPFARGGALAGHKLLDYVPAVLGRVLARRQRAFEGLFVDARGYLSEGTTSNLFVVRRGRLLTPPLDGEAGVLPGVTRSLVIALATAAGIRVQECRLRVSDLVAANEAFCTASVAEVVPIVRIAERAIASGRPGPLTRRVQELYRDARRRDSEKRPL